MMIMSTTTTTATVSFAPVTEGDVTLCSVIHTDGERCAAPIYAKRARLCSKHYVAAKAGRDMDAKVKPVTATTCSHAECEKPIYAKTLQLCTVHYAAHRKTVKAAAAA
jgi:hypothetical protein